MAAVSAARRARLCILPVLLPPLLAAAANAQPPRADCAGERAARSAAGVRAFRAQGPVRIDGVLDEADWQRPSGPPQVQNEPDNGCPPRQRTDWWVVYDDEALFIGARLWDTAPDSIVGRLGRRDAWPSSDWLVVVLDTFNDDRTGYLFGVNPAGAIGDAAIYNDGWDDPSWDGVWEVATRTDRDGWTAEFRIPFSQLNFPDRPEQVWGINFSRRILRYQEREDLYHRPREVGGAVRHYPDLVGIAGIRPTGRRELLAYGAGKAELRQRPDGDPFDDGSRWRGDAGADLRWGLSNDLTLNATVNPDFGQVEVDPAVVNLSDFETFYEERRPFFVEQANVFRFGSEGTNSNWNFNWTDPRPFYSRRIGRAPQLGLDAYDYADVPGATTILGAAKLSGKAGRTDIGFLGAVTAREEADFALDGARGSQLVEPGTGYTVLRARRAAEDGRRGLGAMVTGVRRDLEGDLARASLARDAVTAGLDGWLALDDDRAWALKAFLSASRVAGDAAAMDAIQRSSRHYYQRPDAAHLDYDPTREALAGWAGRAMLNRESGRLQLNTALGAVSPGYEVNDLGYGNRGDCVNWHLAAGWRWQQPTRTFRYRTVTLATYRTWDFGGRPDNHGYGSFFWSQFSNYWTLEARVFHNPERPSLRATRGGPMMRVPANSSAGWWVASDSRRSLGLESEGEVWEAGDGSAGGYATVGLELRPRGALRVSFRPAFSWSRDHAQWVGAVDDAVMTSTYGRRYLFADFEYREASFTTRVDWTFTPRLTLQTYVQPLFAVADYRDLMELARPGSYDFNRYGAENGSTVAHDVDGRRYTIDPDGDGPAAAFALDDPDFNFKSLRVNLVLRWEYRPGSTAYLVWTHNRTNDADPGRFRLGADVRSLLDTPGDNVLMLKVTNWFQL